MKTDFRMKTESSNLRLQMAIWMRKRGKLMHPRQQRNNLSSPLMTTLHECRRQTLSALNGSLECDLKCYEVADRLSELPDEILVSILSRLKLKEVARTSTLSRRWKNLWMYTTGTLDFEYADEFNLMSRLGWRRIQKNGKLRLVTRHPFIAWVNHVLPLHQGLTIDEFEVSCALYGQIRRKTIDDCVAFALKKRVK